jgi:predicted RNase H-like HicB family nuclease
MQYLIIIEATETGFSAYAPDLPGCIATGRTRELVEQAMTEAIAFHLAGLTKHGMAVPVASSSSSSVEIPE